MHGYNRDFSSLMEHYNELLALYEKLEGLTSDLTVFISSGTQADTLNDNLQKNMQVAQRIQEESRKIVELKKNLLEKNIISDSERRNINAVESILSGTVNRLMEQENINREMIMKRGVKIPRR